VLYLVFEPLVEAPFSISDQTVQVSFLSTTGIHTMPMPGPNILPLSTADLPEFTDYSPMRCRKDNRSTQHPQHECTTIFSCRPREFMPCPCQDRIFYHSLLQTWLNSHKYPNTTHKDDRLIREEWPSTTERFCSIYATSHSHLLRVLCASGTCH